MVLDTLVVIVYGNSQRLLGFLLPNDVLAEDCDDLFRGRQGLEVEFGFPVLFLAEDIVAQGNTLVAYMDTRTGDQFLDLLGATTAEGASEKM